MENNNFRIYTDSSCDISVSELESMDIGVISYFINVGGDEYFQDGRTITPAEFYEKIALNEDAMPKTSMPNVQAYTDEFLTALNDGRDVLCITLTSKFSSSFNSANVARNELLPHFPNRKIVIVDSATCTGGQGLIVREAKKLKDAGFSIEETADEINRIKLGQKIYFTVDSLKYLQKGGRIGKVTAFAGALLNIKPIIVVQDGELVPFSKIRGRKKTISEIMTLFDNDLRDKKDDYICLVLHSQSLEEAEALKYTAQHDYGYSIPSDIVLIGPTIGAHIGPTVLGIGYMPKSVVSLKKT